MVSIIGCCSLRCTAVIPSTLVDLYLDGVGCVQKPWELKEGACLTPLGVVGRGAVAGAVGTVAMDLLWFERDHQALLGAVARGILPAESGQ